MISGTCSPHLMIMITNSHKYHLVSLSMFDSAARPYLSVMSSEGHLSEIFYRHLVAPLHMYTVDTFSDNRKKLLKREGGQQPRRICNDNCIIVSCFKVDSHQRRCKINNLKL